jgi:glutaredoxin
MATSKLAPSLSGANPPELVVYGREGCHLCEDMISALRQCQAERCFSFQVIDVDTDPVLRSRYGDRVPVLVAGDKEICHYHLDPVAFGKLFPSG